MNPICSVIIPAFNIEEYVKEAIDSVLAQDCDFQFEVIVVDDGSTDPTAEVVRGYGDKVQLIQKENGGPGSARNVGAAQARADILVFLDADDRMLPGRLTHQVGFMVRHPEVALTFGNRLLENAPEEDANSRYGLPFTEEWRVLDRPYPKLIVEGDYVQYPASAIRRSAYFACGKMPDDIYVGEDYALCCKIAIGNMIAYTSRKLTWYRQQNNANLMSSRHTYYGPAKVLFDNLMAHGGMLTPEEYSTAVKRFRTLCQALIRYEWAFNGRAAALNRLREFFELLPLHYRLFWNAASLCPPVLGRSLRRILHYVRGQTDHRWEACVK